MLETKVCFKSMTGESHGKSTEDGIQDMKMSSLFVKKMFGFYFLYSLGRVHPHNVRTMFLTGTTSTHPATDASLSGSVLGGT